MTVLDSPLEALAFNYVSFGFFTIVNNLWTWIAVVTAAVSVWRIRAAGEVSRCSEPSVSPPHDDRNSNRPLPPCATEEKPASTPIPAKAPANSVEETEIVGATKGGKFSLYYDDVDGELTEEYEEAIDGEMTVTEESDGGEEWWGIWERVLRTRMGKTGWYRYQDLTELNGNVVRLWDGDCRSREGRSCYCDPKRCVLW
ncbi:hypothetical protein L484_004093 [Morus notabilis]|uniref:Uncharacterized protein n=1 Tax=Morus notabilis TaxID=981085 RepID=W9QTM8_9ROSA|nr:uncharacterized protein LOC21387600 [Morus notabilis]EXB38188.1 hypothetical protein L484_004093 [Morus notabilis]